MSFTRTMTAAAVTAVAALAALGGASTASASAATTKCVTLYDFPDAGSKVCVFTEGPCLVGEYRTTILGTEFHCLVQRP
ncbi:MAG TPA: hypothetical protein VGW75_14045 [Solirubrobacteraceae bacterium]|jgi:uncharacterized membrane protein|nr:hypothetical protein [Solirubrobacteraceae bacterium]